MENIDRNNIEREQHKAQEDDNVDNNHEDKDKAGVDNKEEEYNDKKEEY